MGREVKYMNETEDTINKCAFTQSKQIYPDLLAFAPGAAYIYHLDYVIYQVWRLLVTPA